MNAAEVIKKASDSPRHPWTSMLMSIESDVDREVSLDIANKISDGTNARFLDPHHIEEEMRCQDLKLMT